MHKCGKIKSLQRDGTLEPVKQRLHWTNNVLRVSMLVKVQRDYKFKPIPFKGKLLSHGHRQVYQRDCDNFYSPVINFILRLLNISIVSPNKSVVKHVDVRSLFWICHVHRDIFLKWAYIHPNDHLKWALYKLLNSMSGLKYRMEKLWDILINVVIYSQIRTDFTVLLKRYLGILKGNVTFESFLKRNNRSIDNFKLYSDFRFFWRLTRT